MFLGLNGLWWYLSMPGRCWLESPTGKEDKMGVLNAIDWQKDFQSRNTNRLWRKVSVPFSTANSTWGNPCNSKQQLEWVSHWPGLVSLTNDFIWKMSHSSIQDCKLKYKKNCIRKTNSFSTFKICLFPIFFISFCESSLLYTLSDLPKTSCNCPWALGQSGLVCVTFLGDICSLQFRPTIEK